MAAQPVIAPCGTSWTNATRAAVAARACMWHMGCRVGSCGILSTSPITTPRGGLAVRSMGPSVLLPRTYATAGHARVPFGVGPQWARGFQGPTSKNKPCSLHWGLSPGPSVYKTDALPLSYRGASKQATAALVLRWDTAGYDGHAGHSPLWHIVDQRHQGNCGNQGTHVAHGVPCGSLRHLTHKPHHHSQRRAGSPVHWGPATCCHPPIPQQATRLCLFFGAGPPRA